MRRANTHGDTEDAPRQEPVGADAVAAYVESLLPLQQQTIATAQLAGCWFEAVKCERDIRGELRHGTNGLPYRSTKWIETTEYGAYLPDGTYVGRFEDVYEGAIACLAVLNKPEGPDAPDDGAALFALAPENEQ